ncbi:hypothetical protein AURDEDRAFT_145639 [Auricularia subglabra TFB-10046 SS5]|nr:hypothetical protein AURDEDRAFT_145639 [Auricularia subglabra TFB-10046 SS5]
MTFTLERVAPYATFLSLSGLGFYTVLYHVYASGASDALGKSICPVPPTYTYPAQLRYTGFTILDTMLCNLVAFFHASFVPQTMGFMIHFMAGFPPVLLAYIIESARSDSARGHSHLFVGLSYQLLSAAGIMPLGWLAFVLAATRRKDCARKPLTRVQAQSVFVGVMAGFVVPTAVMLVLRDEYTTALWQLFPAFIAAAQHGFLLFRPERSPPEPGLSVVRAALITAAVVAAAPHIYVVYRHPSLATLIQWWPSFRVPARGETTLYTAAAHLLKWDSIIWYTSAIAAACFLAESRKEALKMAVLAPVVAVAVGPGAVLAYYWLQREHKLVQRDEQMSARVSRSRKKI